tara:strand:+ start:2204 stop:3037 length:834 start_codon:yes stop_codon:yes gene_type:complete
MKNKSLTIKDISQITTLPKKYKGMLKHIQESMPSIKNSSSSFYKSHSQFMGVMLDVTHLTPMRSIKHTLAEIDKTRQALEQAHLTMKENDLKISMREKKLKENNLDYLQRELLELKILKLKIDGANTLNSIQGAIRKMSFFTTQYKNILKKIGKDKITEKDFEEEEEKYHIMTAMKQALNAARSRGGQIDEGNLIYLFDMGINSAVAQKMIFEYLDKENQIIKNGKNPSHEMTLEWLNECVSVFQNNSKVFAQKRGFKLIDEKSLLTHEKSKKNHVD